MVQSPLHPILTNILATTKFRIMLKHNIFYLQPSQHKVESMQKTTTFLSKFKEHFTKKLAYLQPLYVTAFSWLRG